LGGNTEAATYPPPVPLPNLWQWLLATHHSHLGKDILKPGWEGTQRLPPILLLILFLTSGNGS